MLFPSDFLTRLEYLSIISKRVFRGQLLAQRRTMQMGSGIEFSDHREYTTGDDLRYLDWNIYARHGDLLLKRFQEEQDLHVYLMLDCSRSMAVGEPAKFDLARHLVAALAYIALADLDRVRAVGGVEGLDAAPPEHRRQHAREIVVVLDDEDLERLLAKADGVLERVEQLRVVKRLLHPIDDRSLGEVGLLPPQHADDHDRVVQRDVRGSVVCVGAVCR